MEFWSSNVSRDDLSGSYFALRLHQQLCPRQPRPSFLSEISKSSREIQLRQGFWRSRKQEDQDWYRHLLGPRFYPSNANVARK